ncbi:MAG: hypothetical protein KBD44_00780 [Candidatus Pacebacteria bacterium]|nr:hypothetical protein [Candidatus Paceibacterota bacterium]
MLKYFAVLLWLFPAFTFAQSSQTGSLQLLLVGIGGFLNSVVIPFILAIAFIVFVVNVVRFFVIGGDSDEGQKNAKNLAIYGIGAFVFILSFWGIVNMVVDGIGLGPDKCLDGISSDYVDRSGDPCPGLDNPGPGDDGNPPPGGDGDPGDDDPGDGGGDPPPGNDAMDQILADIKSALSSSLSVLDGLYGSLSGYVQSDLFAEFLANQQMSRVEEARAILRATTLGMIPFTTRGRFFDAWLAEQIADGILNPTDQEDIEATLPRVLPPNIAARVETIKGDIRRQLDAYVVRGGFVPPLTTPDSNPATPTQVIDYLFNQSTDITTRENYLITLIEDRYDIIDASLGDEIYNDYVDVNNVLTTYNARFNILDERDPNYTGPR